MCYIKSSILGLVLLFLTSNIGAQANEQALSMSYKFKDGIYLSYESWKNDMPDYEWEEVNTRLASNPKTFIAQVEYIYLKEDKEALLIEKVWGICLAGVPYIRLDASETAYSATAFAGLKARGKINYFSYRKEIEEKVVIKAYNPLTRKPFRKGEVPTIKEVVIEKMFLFDDGKVVDFNYVNLLLWIEDDAQLKESVFELSPQEIDEKLYKCLLIYNDRNKVNIPVSY